MYMYIYIYIYIKEVFINTFTNTSPNAITDTFTNTFPKTLPNNFNKNTPLPRVTPPWQRAALRRAEVFAKVLHKGVRGGVCRGARQHVLSE